MKNILLIGCGRSKERKIRLRGDPDNFGDDWLTTIDIDPSCCPSILMDMNDLHKDGGLPFDDDCFDEIHAYDFLEHIGTQGDWRGYFGEFAEYHRVLKQGGLFYALVPIGSDAISDPGHSRFFSINHFCFLSQEFYKNTQVTDYRWYWKKNFMIEYLNTIENHHIAAVLRKA